MENKWALQTLKDMTSAFPNKIFEDTAELSAKILNNDRKGKARKADEVANMQNLLQLAEYI